jgi:hypothetical protein
MAQVIINASGVKAEGLILTEHEKRFLERFQLMCQQAEEREANFQLLRKETLEENYEVRTGHSVDSTAPKHYGNKEKFLYLICSKNLNPIEEIVEGGTGIFVRFIDSLSKRDMEIENLMKENSVLGWGRTEEEAWTKALS